MKFRSVAALAVVLMFAGCGVDVPAGLEDKLKACPDVIKPEPVGVITKGLEVTSVTTAEQGVSCTVKVQDGREVLYVGHVLGADEQDAMRFVESMCRGDVKTGPEQSCGRSRGEGDFTVWGVAGRWQVRINVSDIKVNEDVEEAAFQILADLRASGKGK